MRCFFHRDRDAIAGCKSCGRALCDECIVEVGKSLACRDRCEDDVRQLNTMIERNIRSSAELTTMSSSTAKAFRQARTASVSSALFQLAFGAAALWWGYRSYVDDGEIGIILALGV